MSGGGGEVHQAGGVLRDAGDERDAGEDQLAGEQKGARGRHGVPAGQPPAGLPHLRPGRSNCTNLGFFWSI